jgi:microcystin degradation protein MlrC
MKIAIGQIAHETNTFSSVPTTTESFERWELDYGDAIFETHRNVEDYLGGMIDRANEKGIQLTPLISAFSNPSGIITGETYAFLKHQLLSAISNLKDVDALCLALHGAAVAEGVDDVEGDLLQEIRQIVGGSVPVVVTLDLHGNVTETMVRYADVLLGVNFYPHTDSYDRGKEAVDVAEELVAKAYRPAMVIRRLPLMLPTSTTMQSPARDVNERCWSWEADPNIVDCTFFHGFAHTDCPEVAVSVVVTARNEETLAKAAADDVADFIWSVKDKFFPEEVAPEVGIGMALAAPGRPIVLNETSDNPGGGTPGDGTHLLRAMLSAGLTDACFGTIYDPEVARIAHEAGVGRVIDIQLGGKTDTLHGDPLSVRAYVKTLSDGKFTQSSPMWRGKKMDLGQSARLQIQGIDVIVCSLCSQVFDEQTFLLHGIDVHERKIVALKSSQHFRAAYQSIADTIITVDSPGLSSRQLSSFPYVRLTRPIYPLDQVHHDVRLSQTTGGIKDV